MSGLEIVGLENMPESIRGRGSAVVNGEMEQCQQERGRGGLDAISTAGQTYPNTELHSYVLNSPLYLRLFSVGYS